QSQLSYNKAINSKQLCGHTAFSYEKIAVSCLIHFSDFRLQFSKS
uniref:Transposase n=1 Tax=Mesocestoides corti TaxID=53468 RepID=A0A5K3EMB6_MESCO